MFQGLFTFLANVVRVSTTIPRKPPKKLVKGSDYNLLAAMIERLGSPSSGGTSGTNKNVILFGRIKSVLHVGIYTVCLYREDSIFAGAGTLTSDLTENMLGKVWPNAQGIMIVRQEAKGGDNLFEEGDEISCVHVGAIPSGTDSVPVYDCLGGGGAPNLPKPQYQHMVLQGITGNQIGYDFVMTHPVL